MNQADNSLARTILDAVLDGDPDVATTLLQDLDVQALQELAHASQTLTSLCRDAALAIIWPDEGGFLRKTPRLGMHDGQRKD